MEATLSEGRFSYIRVEDIIKEGNRYYKNFEEDLKKAGGVEFARKVIENTLLPPYMMHNDLKNPTPAELALELHSHIILQAYRPQ